MFQLGSLGFIDGSQPTICETIGTLINLGYASSAVKWGHRSAIKRGEVAHRMAHEDLVNIGVKQFFPSFGGDCKDGKNE